MTLYYLRANTVAEPMVNRWYAWSMLISPATAALVTVNAHISIMQSYLRMPKMHAVAAGSAKMRGGPFIDFGGEEKVQEVSDLLAKMNQDCAHIIEFGHALKALDQLLLEEADGHSLIPLFDKIPEILRGYVELVYDANHQPGYRLLESLLYRSPYYNEQGQELMLSSLQGDSRSFVLSTPRLCFKNELIWKMPFKDKALDQFFALREHGMTKENLEAFYQQYFPNTDRDRELFWSLMTTEAPVERDDFRQYQGEGVRIRYFGHASVLIESRHTNIMIDCMASYGYETDIPRYTYDDIPSRLDYVILTHSHQDHVMLEHLLQLRYKIENIVVPKNTTGSIQDPSLKLMLKQLNFKNVIEMDELDSIPFTDGAITGLPFFGEHGDLNINSKMAYVVAIQNKSILFLADSNNLEPKLYEHLQQQFPIFDVIFLGMECEGAPMSWLYGPVIGKSISRPMDQSRRLDGSDCHKAMNIIRRFNCKQIYIYAMGQEPWLGYITSIEYSPTSKPLVESNLLMNLCRSENRIAERPYAMKEIRL